MPVRVHHLEAEACVQPFRRVPRLDLERHGQAVAVGRVEHPAQQRRTDSPAARLGQERDLDDPHLVVQPGHVQATDAQAVDQDDQEPGGRIRLAVARVLGVELHRDEARPLVVGPRDGAEFVGSRGAVQGDEEVAVGLDGRPEAEAGRDVDQAVNHVRRSGASRRSKSQAW